MCLLLLCFSLFFFFFNDTATTEIYTLSLHDALPIYEVFAGQPQVLEALGRDHIIPAGKAVVQIFDFLFAILNFLLDRKSTRLNSSHTDISRMPSSA